VVAGDLGDAAVRAAALGAGVDAVIHLATVPGGAAEADPAASRRINVDAMYDLLLEATALGRPRFVYASSIAVYGDPLPAQVDDATPLSPKMIYGAHKAMMEHAVALFTNRGAIEGVTVRLPGILARPKGPSGMKSAFMSNLFHALNAWGGVRLPGLGRRDDLGAIGGGLRRQFPACPHARYRVAAADLCRHAARVARDDGRSCHRSGAAMRASADLVRYEPDAALEAAFGAQPPLQTPAAERAGFAHDGNLARLVESALATLA
jgi:hypothetical protein